MLMQDTNEHYSWHLQYYSIKNTESKMPEEQKHKSMSHSALCIMTSFREKRNDFYVFTMMTKMSCSNSEKIS